MGQSVTSKGARLVRKVLEHNKPYRSHCCHEGIDMKHQNWGLGRIDQPCDASALELSLDAGNTETVLAGAIARAPSGPRRATGFGRGPHFDRNGGSEVIHAQR